jgi:hypothetical protein
VDDEAAVTATGEHDGVSVTISAPPGTDPELVSDMAQKLAENAHLLRQCCPADTYDTDSAGDLRPTCSCDGDCGCLCDDCRCRSRWGEDDDG